jgi:hypothetical protein
VHDVEPGSDVVPSGQTSHRNAPLMLENVPAGHDRQELSPGVGANNPAAHGAHGSNPVGDAEPAGHGVDVVVVVVGVHSLEPGNDVVPGGQGWHSGEPGSAKVSAGHVLHCIDPGLAAAFPPRHTVHGAKPVGENAPNVHCAGSVVVVAVHDAEPGSDVVPGGHAWHTDEPGSANVSAGQLSHCIEPSAGAAVPAGHSVHGWEPVAENDPGGHGAAVHEEEPGGAVEPSAQSWHTDAPKVSENVFAGQSRQMPPTDGLNCPGLQGTHGPPLGPCVPAGHGASVVVVTGVHDADPGSDVEPGAHGRQLGVPLVGANVFAGHAEHVSDPGFGASYPAAQSVHGSLPSLLKRPGSHG